MLFHRVSLLTLSLVFSFSLQAQILITPDNSTTVEETSDDSGGQIVLPPRGSARPNPTPAPANPTSASSPAVTKKKTQPPAKANPAKTQNNVQVVQPQNNIQVAQPQNNAEPLSPNSVEEKALPPKKKSTRDSFVLGFDMRSYKYEEPDFVTHAGLMYGATAKYLMVYQSGELNLNTELLYGKLNYDGSISESDGMGGSTTRPIEVTSTDILNKSNALWQWTPLGYNSPFALKFGLGYRLLSDNYTDRGFYRRDGFWVYVPVGVQFRLPLSPETQMTFDLTYQQIVYGGIDSKLSELGISGLDDIYFSQKGHGLELEVGAVFSKTYHVSAYFEGWYMDDSETVSVPTNALGIATLQEPANSAISYGIKLAYDLF